MKVKSLRCVRLFASLWTVAHQTPLSMGFSRQESWSGLPCPLPGDLPNPGIKSIYLMSLALPSRLFTTSTICEALAPILVLSECIYLWIRVSWVLLVIKNPLPMQEMQGFNLWFGKIPWRRKWQPTPVFLPEKFHGQRSLVGYSPWSCNESYTSTHTHTHIKLMKDKQVKRQKKNIRKLQCSNQEK